jgi:flagellar hook-length control protein FliK
MAVNNDVLNQLQLLIRGSAPQLIEISDQPTKELVPFVPGERYVAKVQEQISDGRFLVQIRDQKLDLNLPRNTQAGQNIELRFVSATPRLTFVLAQAVPLPAGQAPTPVNLSDGARYLNALLDRVQTLASEQAQAPAPAPAPGKGPATTQTQAALSLLSAKPVLEGAPPATPQFAALLKDAVSKSGLFYESHQAQWAAGEKPLTELLREPQGKLSEPRAFASAQPSAVAQPGQLIQPDAAQQVKAAVANHLAATGATLAENKSAEPVHPQTAPLVQQQLDVLDTRQLVWQGQVWPGQDMRWQIEERAAREGEADVAREWQTRLDLHLPNLGEVNALLKISPQGGIQIALTAHSPEIAQTLKAASAALNQNLESAGLQLTRLEVSDGG